MRKSEGVMTYEEYMAAPLDSEVIIETYVAGKAAPGGIIRQLFIPRIRMALTSFIIWHALRRIMKSSFPEPRSR